MSLLAELCYGKKRHVLILLDVLQSPRKSLQDLARSGALPSYSMFCFFLSFFPSFVFSFCLSSQIYLFRSFFVSFFSSFPSFVLSLFLSLYLSFVLCLFLLLLQAVRHPEVSRRRTSSPNVRGSWLGWFGVHQIVAQKDLNPLVTLPRLVRLPFPGKEPRKGWHVEILPSLTLSSDLHTPLASHCSGGEISNSIQLSYLTSVCTTPYSHVVGYCACSVVFNLLFPRLCYIASRAQ